MIKKKKRQSASVNASSMADIAFLLLIFFLVTTTIASDKGIPMRLPPKYDQVVEIEVHQREVLAIIINSRNDLVIEEQLARIGDVSKWTYKHITNNNADPNLASSAEKAIISIKADRSTSHEMYIRVLDQVKKGIHQARANYLGIDLEEYLKLDKNIDAQKELIEKAKKAFPMQISEAEPTDVGGAK